MRKLNKIILHCADTKPNMDIGVDEIRKWHVRDNGWKDIGYHWVIRRDGTIEKGRDESVIGAHCYGYNTGSIGICLVGGMAQNSSKSENNFTKEQFDSLAKLIKEIRQRYSYTSLKIFGHKELGNTDCPVFPVTVFLRDYNINREY